MPKLVFNFKSKDTIKIKNPKNILGGKGANLSEMGRMGLPVPPGFTISTEVCDLFYKNKKKLKPKIINEINKELKFIEGGYSINAYQIFLKQKYGGPSKYFVELNKNISEEIRVLSKTIANVNKKQ